MTPGRRQDDYYFRAKRLDYRSRAAFKLLEIQEKFKVIGSGPVLEFGSSPGGWSQVTAGISEGPILSIDRTAMAEIPGVSFMKKDMFDPSLGNEISGWLKAHNLSGFATVLSDAMSKTTGNQLLDHSRSYEICKRVLELSRDTLLTNGSVVMKMFQGDLTAQFVKDASKDFSFHKVTSVSASRPGSSEVYVILKRFTGP